MTESRRLVAEEDLAEFEKTVDYGITEFVKHTRQRSSRLLKRLRTHRNDEHFLARAFVHKNLSTIKAIGRLLRDAQLEDALVLMRLALERSALSFKMINDGLSIEQVERLRASKCISDLKKYLTISRFYGTLSKTAHCDTYMFASYLAFDSSLRKLSRTERVPYIRDVTVLHRVLLCCVCEVNFAVMEFIAKEHFNKVPCWRPDAKRGWRYIAPRGLMSWDLLPMYRELSGQGKSEGRGRSTGGAHG